MTQPEHLRRLEWAIWFSQAPLQDFSEGDWLNVERDLAAFMWESGTPTDFVAPGWYDAAVLQRMAASIQKGLRQQFEKLATFAVFLTYSGSKTNLSATGFEIDGRLTLYAYEGEPYTQALKAASIESQVYAALASYLISTQIVAGQIRKCPTCARIFLLKRKPRSDVTFHCSLKCSRLAATRRYRTKLAVKEGEPARAKERARHRRRYVAKQRVKLGRNVKIEARPRKK